MVMLMMVMVMMLPGSDNGIANSGSGDCEGVSCLITVSLFTSLSCSWLKRLLRRKQKEKKWKGKNIIIINLYILPV